MQSLDLFVSCQVNRLSKLVLVNNRWNRGYMVLCGNCQENVKPSMYFNWRGFIRGLGIPYMIYFMTKIPQCPNCNFPMPRRNMVFAIQPPQYSIKLPSMSILQLTHFRDRVISTSWKSYLNRKFDPTRHFPSMNRNQTTSYIWWSTKFITLLV